MGEAGAASVLSPVIIVRMHPRVHAISRSIVNFTMCTGGEHRPFA
jgi:hypothetical protein